MTQQTKAQTERPVVALVMPNRPTLDKVIAAVGVQLALRQKFDVVYLYCHVNEPDKNDFREWGKVCSLGHNPILIDVGNNKYHNQTGSAAEMVKRRFHISHPIYCKLAQIATDNNKNGYLKKSQHSVARIMRQIVHLDDLTTTEMVDRVVDVVDAYFLAPRRTFDCLFKQKQHHDLFRIWQRVAPSGEKSVADFNLAMYLRQLFCSGTIEDDEIIAKINWWRDREAEVGLMETVATAKVTAPNYQYYSFAIGNIPCGVFEAENYFETIAILEEFLNSGKLMLGIIRHPSRHSLIKLSRKFQGIELRQFFEKLNELEPKRWYAEIRYSSGTALMNGSPQYDKVPPTSFAALGLVKLASDLVRIPQAHFVCEGERDPARVQTLAIKR
jgi:hypothetical protein